MTADQFYASRGFLVRLVDLALDAADAEPSR
ncbi:hypothetical protein MPTA5024_11190 [Microbispora sp. ATCC PTA-5024]|nr:hypothetical protein MPTA5024_11190 [Microbispora sp. ATCC PTA-5024]